MRLLLPLAALAVAWPAWAASQTDLGDLEAAIASGRLPGAADTIQALAGGSPLRSQDPFLVVAAGRIALARGGADIAEQAFGRIALEHATHAAAPYAKAYLGMVSLARGRTDEAAQTLATVVEDIQDLRVRARLRLALAEALAASARGRDAMGQVRAALADAQGTELAAVVLADGKRLVDHSLTFSEIRRLYEELDAESAFAEVVCAKLAKVMLHVRAWEQARETVVGCRERFPQGEHRAQAEAVIKRLDALTRITPGTVGVLLPLSGKFRAYGRRALLGIRLAVDAEFETEQEREPAAVSPAPSNPEVRKQLAERDAVKAKQEAERRAGHERRFGSAGITFLVRDTGGDPQQAIAAFESLVFKEGVVAVLGPLFSHTAVAVAHKAEELRVPLLALSRAEGLTAIGDYVFRNSLTNSRQAEVIARHAITTMGLEKFAILYPEAPYGVELMNLFWDWVEILGGEVVGVESYPQDAKTFQTPVRKLVGRYYLSARREYRYLLGKELKDKKGFARLKGAEAAAKKTPPAVDFDGLFIPDYYRTVSLLAPAIAYEDVVLYTESKGDLYRMSRATGRWEYKMVRLLGANGFNHPGLAKRGGKYVRHATFVDGFYPQSGEEATVRFVTRYKSAAGRDPSIVDAQAYDGAAMVAEVMKRVQPTSRASFRKGLLEIRDFPGATGPITVAPDGEARRPLYILTVDRRGKLRLWDDVHAEEPPAAGGQGPG